MVTGHTSTVEDITVIVRSWDAVSNLDVRFPTPLVWPEVELLAERCRLMYQQAEGTESLRGMARLAYRAVRMLTCSPASPDHESSKLCSLVEQCDAFVDRHPQHSVVKAVSGLRHAAALVLNTTSPVRSKVEGELANYGVELEQPWRGEPSGVVVVPPDLVAVTEAFLVSEDLTAHVRTPEQAKHHHYRGAIVCGDLRTAYRSFWVSPESAARSYGWLLTAPPADAVVVVQTRGFENTVESLWLLGPGAHPLIEMATPTGGRRPVSESLPMPPPRSVYPVQFEASSTNETQQPASQVLLASERSVFFAKGIGPQPRLVFVEEGEADIRDGVSITALAVGDLLVIRASGSDYEEVKARAEHELIEDAGWTPEDIARARGFVDMLKRRLRSSIDSRGERSVRDEMVRYGLSEGYAKTLCRNPLSEQYIAPTPKKGGFGPLVRAIGAPELIEQEQWFVDLRTAHRKAGADITDELKRRLSDDLAWLDVLAVQDFAIVADESLGALIVEAIAYPAEAGYTIPVSYLGRVVGGNPLKPIEVDRRRVGR